MILSNFSTKIAKVVEKMVILLAHMLSDADLWPKYCQYMLVFARSLIYRHIGTPPNLYPGNKLSEPSRDAARLVQSLPANFVLRGVKTLVIVWFHSVCGSDTQMKKTTSRYRNLVLFFSPAA